MKSKAIIIQGDKNYVVIEDLPEDQRTPFEEWLLGQTTPVIPEEELLRGKVVWCAWAWDYNLWHAYWSKDEEAPKGFPDNDEINTVINDETIHDIGHKESDGVPGP